MSHNKVVEELNGHSGEINIGFELSEGSSSVNSEENDACCGGVDGDGHLPVYKLPVNLPVYNLPAYTEREAACACEEKEHTCACRGTAPKSGDVERNQKVVYESWDKWKCMCLLIIVVAIVTWIAIFSSILATRNR